MAKARPALTRVAATRKPRAITSITLPITPRLREALCAHTAYLEAQEAYDAAMKSAQRKLRPGLAVLRQQVDAAYKALAAPAFTALPLPRILEAAFADYNWPGGGRAAAYSLMRLSLAAVTR